MKKLEVPLNCVPYDIQDEDEYTMEMAMEFFTLDGMNNLHVLKMHVDWSNRVRMDWITQ